MAHFHYYACILTVEPRKKKLFHRRSWLSDLVAEAPTGERIVGAEVLASIDRHRPDKFGSESFTSTSVQSYAVGLTCRTDTVDRCG